MWDLLGEVENGPGLGPFTDWAWITCTAASHGCHTRTLRLSLLSLLNVSMFCLKKINGPVEPVRLPRDKDTCCTDLTPEFHLRTHMVEGGNLLLKVVLLLQCTIVRAYTHVHMYAQRKQTNTQIVIKQIFKWPWKLRGRERMLIWYFFFSETGFSSQDRLLCVALAVLELTVKSRLASNSQIWLPLPPKCCY